MHEFSICQSLVADVLKELDKLKNRRVCLKKVRILAGQYNRLVPASMRMAYQVLTEDTPAAGSKLLIKSIPVRLKCRLCGWQGAARDICFVCRKCGRADTEIIGGKEICLESLEVVQRKAQIAKAAK